MNDFSTNERAERLLGRRPEGVFSIDQPCELGYWCPVCRVPALAEGAEEFDERLDWSEYNGFLWCSVCNMDYPSALCIPLDAIPEHDWQKMGVAAAVSTFLDTLEESWPR